MCLYEDINEDLQMCRGGGHLSLNAFTVITLN